MPSDGLRRSVGIVALGAAYWLAARLGLAFAVVHESVSPVWPAAGLALGVLVLAGRGYWPGVALGALAANLATTGDLPSSLLIAAGNTTQAFVGAWAVQRMCGGTDAFDRPDTTGRFVFWAGVVAPLLASLVGATALASSGLAAWTQWPSLWAAWYVGDAVGTLVVAPAVILLPRLWSHPVPEGVRAWEAVAFLAALAAVGLVAFGPLRPAGVGGVRLGVLALPVVAWAATRLGVLVSTWSVASISGMILEGIREGTLVLLPRDANVALLEMQALLALLSVSGLLVAAVVQERRSAYVALAAARDLLEATVEERTRRLQSAMADLHEAQELAGLGRWQYNDRSGLFSGSPWLHRTFDVGTAAPLSAWTRSMPAADAADWTERMREAMATGRPFTTGFRLRLGDETKHLQFTGAPLPGRGWHGTCQDVTRAREAAGTAQRLAVLVQTSPHAIVAADAHGTIDTWNEAAAALLGYRTDEAVGMALARIVPLEERAGMQALRERVMRTRTVVEMDCDRVHRDGHLIPVHVTLAPVDDPLGGLRLTAIMRDRRPEIDAAETDAMLKTVVESAPVAIITLSPDGEVLTWNHAAERLYGHPAVDIVGRSITTIAPESPTSRHADALARGEVVGEAGVEHVRGDGERVPVGLTLAPILDDAGTLRFVSCLARDLRPELEARRMADEARRIEHELQVLDELDRLKTEFINMASHELRTPLTPIRVQLHLLKAAPLDEAGRLHAVNVIERNMIRLSLLVEDVFAAARLQHDGFAIKARETDLAAVSRDALSVFDGQAGQGRVRLDLNVRGDVRLRADADRVTQVLFNLVSNALKHAPADSTVHVDLTGRSDDVLLAVEDEGPGITEEQRALLFQPFGRLEHEGAKPGTGLGLYICKGIAELHGGRIDVTNGRYGGGARFEVVLPRRPPAPTDEQAVSA